MSPTAETITAAMQQIEPKKQNLKKAFDDLQSHSDVLSLFSLSWSDLDSHFTSLHTSLTQKLHLLQTLESQLPSSSNSQTQMPKVASLPTQIEKVSSLSHGDDLVAPRKELVEFCEKMDGAGLMKYVNGTKSNRNKLRSELFGALRRAPDPALMVLDAMEGFYGESEGGGDVEVSNVRRSCVLLLEVLCGVVPNVGVEVRERARKLALEWRGKVSLEKEDQLESMGLLHLVVAFGVVDEFKVDELVDHMVVVARYKQATDLCRRLGLEDKATVTDLIEKLMSKGKHLFAIKFVSEFDMTDKFPPVPILKAYVKESERLAKKISEEGNNSKKAANEAIAKETGALKSVLKIIEDLKLESEYPLDSLERRIDQLEKEKADRKRLAAAPAGKPFQLHQQYGNKLPRMTAPVGSAAVSNGTAGLLVMSSTAYVSSSAAPYVVSGTAPPVAPYMGSSTGQYGFAGGQMGFPGTPGPSSTHLYSSKHNTPSGYYNSLTAYGGYGVPPQYHPSYYSQQ